MHFCAKDLLSFCCTTLRLIAELARFSNQFKFNQFMLSDSGHPDIPPYKPCS